ncbi:ammonium transporter, Amt family [Collimonas sp. OK242]|uniref:ammonium transporter n=1 Tax=Collimonas sp. OK242 TaxID=1798195 RepID=UPI00089A19BF|nr:ammonium transporter [Collimonas sp. OK242]SDY23471.1 ammonium transporter, Amt family [Collimonas sp. OK242]
MTPTIMPINIGNTAFMLLCSSLVMLMTPGLAFFYGGLVGRKNVLAIMMQSFISLGWTTVLWFAFGYSMCFGPSWHGIIGDPTYYAFLHGITLESMYTGNDAGIPLIVHVAYQMMFAIITPALITGAFANRVTFKAYFLFLTGWLVFVYFPFVHMVWSPDGLFAKWGVLDYAGGIVVHNTAGFAALASVLYVGRRQKVELKPHNVPLIALGSGLLWFGWYGFNAGSEFRVDAVTASAFLNTDVAASFGAITWLFIEWFYHKKPKFVGLLTGGVAGLATITPAAGYVSLGTAAIIGICAGLICFYAVALKNRLGWDDALDVWGVHGVGGMAGTILLGVFASKAWNANGADGLLLGNSSFFLAQCGAVILSGIWAFAFTYGMLWLINLFTPVKVGAETQDRMDEDLHGEDAYLHA